jgi:putative DNA primase/helicase
MDLFEISELQSMTQGEVGKIKAFVSRTSDRFRPPYGRHLVESPRQCVFAGTVNESSYLRDETGGRRFWPIACGRIDTESLARDRDQLWAEARDRFRAGNPWWMETDYLVGEAEKEQADRYKGDPWHSVVSDWAANRIEAGFDSVSTAEILELCLEKKKSEWTRADEMRVGACLRVARWERYRDRKRGMEWRYRPPVPTSGGNSSEDGNTRNG